MTPGKERGNRKIWEGRRGGDRRREKRGAEGEGGGKIRQEDR